MSDTAKRAKDAANSPDNAAQREHNQRTGTDEDRAAHNPETDPRATSHPAGEQHARTNAENEPAA